MGIDAGLAAFLESARADDTGDGAGKRPRLASGPTSFPCAGGTGDKGDLRHRTAGVYAKLGDMTIPSALKTYLIGGIAGTPAVMSRLAESITDWDACSSPERFTYREALAHLADWDAIFGERIHRILTEEHPTLPDIDEGQLAVERDYASQEPGANLARFRESREALVAQLSALGEDDWHRFGFREKVGDLSLLHLATMILGHDAYHIQQFAEAS